MPYAATLTGAMAYATLTDSAETHLTQILGSRDSYDAAAEAR